MQQKNITKEKFTNYLSLVFLTCLGLLAFVQIFSTPLFGFDINEVPILSTLYFQLSTVQYALVVFAIAIGALLFYANREKIESIEEEQTREELEEEKRKREFGEKFPVISRIPVFGWIMRLKNIMTLSLIILFFVLFRIDYLDKDFFNTAQPMKNAAYIEPAKYMIENDNPMHYQKKYRSDPIDNPEGIFRKFDHIPFIEWGIYYTNKITNGIFPLEITSRIFTTFLGSIIIAFVFYAFLNIGGYSLATIFAIILSSSYIFNFLTYETVNDLVLFTFFFISLYLFIKDKEKINIKIILFLVILTALATLNKYSYLVFGGVFYGILILLDSREKFIKKLLLSFIFGFFTILYIYLHRKLYFTLELNYIFVLFLVPIITYIFGFLLHKLLLDRYYKEIENILLKYKYYFFSLFLIIIILIPYFIINHGGLVGSDFITDKYLILNYNLYYQIFNWVQGIYKPLVGLSFFILPFLVIFLYKKERKLFNLYIGLLITSIIYVIVASKIIYFHFYYLFFFGILFTFSISSILYLIYKYNKNKLNYILILIITIVISLSYYNRTIEYFDLKKDNDFLSFINYINSNIKDEEKIFISTHELSLISLYTGNPTFAEDVFHSNLKSKNNIINNGFLNVLKSYNINYFITWEDKISYYNIGLLNLGKEKDRRNRTDNILHRTGIKKLTSLAGYSEAINSFNNSFYSILSLEYSIGKFKIYKINH